MCLVGVDGLVDVKIPVCLRQVSLSKISCFRWSFVDTVMKMATWILTTTSVASWGWTPCVVSFVLWSEADAVQRFYHDDSKDWLIVPFPHSGAFKTLDKDNNGTIKVNVQEVKSDLNDFKLVLGFWFWWREWEVNKNVLVFFSSGFSWRCILESGRGPSPSFFTTTLFTAKVIANPCTCRFIL